MKIVLLGPPGGGKGTHGERISNKCNIQHITTGDIIRDEISKGTKVGKRAKEYVENGELVPDKIVIEIIKRTLEQGNLKTGFVLDGFPRTIAQAEALDEIAEIDVALNLKAPEEVLIRRLSSRRTCRDCGEVYNLVTMKPKEQGICDKCGGKLYQREDDRPDVIKNRLDEYETKTEPLLQYYEEKSILKEVSIEEERPVHEIAELIFDTLEDAAN